MTSLWRYTAIEIAYGGTNLSRHRGELAGATAAEVRASLRRIGLQVIELKPVQSGSASAPSSPILAGLRGHWRRHVCNRRRTIRAELYDSLGTMLESGIPLLEAVQTLLDSQVGAARSARVSMLSSIRESLRAGESLGNAMRACGGGWFDATDVAIVDAGQHAGNLAQVLVSMAQRQEHANELGHKLTGALAYPFMVLLVGIGVVVFLSVKTLPQLVKILTDAKVTPPALTLRVMGLGQFLANHFVTIILVFIASLMLATFLPMLASRFGTPVPVALSMGFQRLGRRLTPKVMSTMAVGGLALRLAELVKSGVPMVDALRVLGPTVRSRHLRQQLKDAADRVERGEELSAALASGPESSGRAFSAEFMRLLDIGQASGELDLMLERIGQRYQRLARRQIDRLATLLEPVVILTLAALVGTVVMAAILPLLRLQEVVR